MLIKRSDAARMTSLSESLIEKLVARNEFPQPVPLSAGRVGFVEDEVRAWAASRVAARDEGLPPAEDPVLVATGYGLGSTASRAGAAK